MQLTLRYQYKDDAERAYRSTGNQIIIGRPGNITPDLDLSPDLRVSREHARLYRQLSAWWVEDLLSKNETILNSSVINQATTLSPGDTLQLGDTRLRVEFPSFETQLPDGVLESQMAVSEVDPPPSISEDKRTELLANFTEITENYSDPQAMLVRFSEEIRVVLPQAEHMAILMIECDGELMPRASWPPGRPEFSYTLVRKAIQSQQALHWIQATSLEGGRAASLFDTTVALCAPMVFNAKPIGALYLGTTQPGIVFGEEDQDLLGQMASIIAPPLKAAEGPGLASFPSVFVSYAAADRDFVDRLAADLRRRRIKVWFDERLRVGTDRQEQIATAIGATNALVLVMSPDSVAYDPVLRELGIARSRKKRIFPVMYKPCEAPKPIQSLVSLPISSDHIAEDFDKLAEAVYATYKTDLARLARNGEKEESMRILFLAANPRNTDQLRLSEEARTIDERLRGAEFRDSFELVSHWAVRHTDLSDYLLRHTPHIVHFAGHGSTGGKIVLEDELGNAKTVPPEALSRLFRILKDNIRCVVLNACLTEAQAEGIVQEIDCVVGMSEEIEDVDAISFAGGFYRGLAYGRSVQTAFDLGCNEIDLDSLSRDQIPKLLVKPGLDAADITFV